MRFFLVLVAVVMPLVGSADQAEPRPGQQQDRHWEGDAKLCGLSFKILKDDWVVVPRAREAGSDRCVGEVKHKRWETLVERDDPDHFWTMSIEVVPQPFDDLAASYGIHRVGQRWFVGIGAAEQPAYEISGPGWWGLRVDVYPVRAHAKAGGYVGMNDSIWLAVESKTSKRSVVVQAGRGSEDALPLLISTLKFD